jgi:hypothetical protein
MRTASDIVRELQKISDVIDLVDKHFMAEAEMNAAQHMASVVRPAPLTMATAQAKDDLHRLIKELEDE